MTENRGPLEYEIRPKPYGWDGVELVFDFGTRENAEYVAKFMAMALTLAPNAVGCEVMRDFIIEHAITITDERGLALDAVLTADLSAWYEELTGKPFYRPHDSP